MTLMQRNGKPSMTSIWKVSPHMGGNQFCLLDLNPNKLLIVSESWVSTYKLEVVFPMNGSPFAPRLEAMEGDLNGEITRNYKTKQQFIDFLKQCGIQPDPKHPFNIRKLFEHEMTAAWLPYPKMGKTNSGTGSRSEEELKVNRSSDGMKLREKIALTFDKALMLMGHDIAQRFTWDDLLGVVDILIDFINGNGATDTFNFDLLGMAFATAQWNGLRDISNFFDAVKEVAFYSPAPWIGEALDPVAKSLTTSSNYIGFDYLLGFLVQYGSKTVESFWPNGRAALETAIKNNQYNDLFHKLPQSKKITLKEQARNIATIYKVLEQTGIQFNDIHKQVVMAALEINEVPVKFEFDLDEPIKMQTPDGGEILMTFKGDITLIKNNKEIEVKEGNNTQTLTAKGMGMEIENKEKTSPQTSTVDNVSVEFGKTEANIDYDRLFSIVAKNGTTFSAGTHLVSVGNKLYCRYKQESPEATFTFPDDPLGNSWSGKSHGWTVTVDYRPGDHENSDYSGLSPEFVLDEYYFQLLYQLLANEKKSREKEHYIMKEKEDFKHEPTTNKNIKTQPHSSSSSTIDTLTPLQNLSAAFYPTHALAYRGIDPAGIIPKEIISEIFSRKNLIWMRKEMVNIGLTVGVALIRKGRVKNVPKIFTP